MEPQRAGQGMKGYLYPFDTTIELVDENVLTGCRRCRETWREPRRMLKHGARINGPMYDYDYCDKCITPQEESDLNPEPRPKDQRNNKGE
jgi:hypothetical protein